MSTVIPGLIASHFEQCPVHKISAKDTNKFVLLCDRTQANFTSFIEIFDVGGRTPSNEHVAAFEYFYILKGEGIAKVGDFEAPIGQGSFVIIPPGNHHDIINTGSERLYALTTMVPDENFSDLIKNGPKAELDEEDLNVLLNFKKQQA